MLRAALAAGAGLILGRAGLDAANNIAHAFVDPATLPVKYAANAWFKTGIPAPSDIVDAWLGRRLETIQMYQGMALNNIPLLGSKDGYGMTYESTLWDAVVTNKIAKMPLDAIVHAVYSGLLTEEDANKIFKRYSFDKDQWNTFLKILEPAFDQGIVLSNYLRGYRDYEESKAAVRKLYGCDGVSADKILDLSMVLPPIQDLIRFVVRDAFNPQAVIDLELDAEYGQNTDFERWCNAQGLGTVKIYDSEDNEHTLDVPRYYWRSHWVLPSPTQLYTFRHRLREGRIEELAKQFPGLVAFGKPDLDTYLRANDYTPKVRKWLEAVSYNVIGRIDLRRGYNNDDISETEVLEQIKDQGYNDRDSDILLKIANTIKKKTKEAEEEKLNNKIYGKYRQQIVSSYKEGSIGKENAFVNLIATNLNEDVASALLAAVDVDVNRSIAKELVKQTRAEFLLGGMEGLKAVEILQQSGIDRVRAQQYVQLWQRQQTRKRKTASTNQLVDWYSRGYMSIDELRERLILLGWTGADVLLLLAESGDKLDQRVAHAEAIQARTEQQRLNAARRLEKEAQAQTRSALSRLAGIFSPTRMAKWYSLGEMSISEIEARLMTFGWPQDAIAKYTAQLLIEGGRDGKES